MSAVRIVVKVLVVLALVVGGLIGAGAAILASQDFGRMREVVEGRISAATGRELAIAGDIHIKPAWVPTLSADGVRFANAPWASEPAMLSAGRLEAEIELLPLLTGEVRLKTFRMVDGLLVLERRSDGAANWQLAGGGQASDTGASWLADLRAVEVREFRTLYRDAVTGREFELDLDGLRIGVSGSDRTISADMRGALSGVSMAARGTLGSLDAWLSGRAPAAVDLDGSVAGVELSVAGVVEHPHAMDGLNLAFSARSESLASVAALLHERADMPVPDMGWRAGSLAGRLQGGPGKLALADAKLDLRTGLAAVSAEGSVGELSAASGVNVSFSIKGESLAAVLERLGDRAPAALRWLGPMGGPFSASGRARGAAPGALELSQLEAHFAGVGETELHVASTAAAGSPAQAAPIAFSLRSNEPRALAGHPVLAPVLGGAAPVLTAPLHLQGRFDLNQQGRVALDSIEGRLGEQTFAGAVAVDANQSPTAVRVDFRAPRVDLARLGIGAEAASGAAQGPAPDAGRVFSHAPLPVQMLDGIDLSADVRIDTLTGGGWELRQFATTFRARPQGLTVSLLDGQLAGGRLAFKGEARRIPATGEVALSLTGSGRGLDAGALLQWARGSTPLTQSALNFEVDLDGKGGSVGALAATSNGKLHLTLGPGRIESSLLSVAGGDLFSGLFAALTPFYSGADMGELYCGVALFDIEDGVATAKRGIAVETGRVNIVGSGAVDLGREQLDLSLQPVARQGLGVNLASIADVWQIRGTLTDPKLSADAGKVTRKAFSLGAALATGGVSLLAEGLLGRMIEDPNPCKSVLEGGS